MTAELATYRRLCVRVEALGYDVGISVGELHKPRRGEEWRDLDRLFVLDMSKRRLADVKIRSGDLERAAQDALQEIGVR